MRPTRPSEASMDLTGHLRSEVRKQDEAGSCGDADGYQRKSRMDTGYGKSADVLSLNNWSDLSLDLGRKADLSGPLGTISQFTQSFDCRQGGTSLLLSVVAYACPV